MREELSRLVNVEERHRRLLARLLLALGLSLVVFGAGTLLIWVLESGRRGGDIHGFGDAAFFTAVQLLTVSSQIKKPLTSGGKVVDVGLENDLHPAAPAAPRWHCGRVGCRECYEHHPGRRDRAQHCESQGGSFGRTVRPVAAIT